MTLTASASATVITEHRPKSFYLNLEKHTGFMPKIKPSQFLLLLVHLESPDNQEILRWKMGNPLLFI